MKRILRPFSAFGLPSGIVVLAVSVFLDAAFFGLVVVGSSSSSPSSSSSSSTTFSGDLAFLPLPLSALASVVLFVMSVCNNHSEMMVHTRLRLAFLRGSGVDFALQLELLDLHI